MPSAAPTRSFKLGSPGRALAKATAWCVAWVILAFPGRGEAAISFVRMHGNIAESGQAATSMSAGIGAPIAVGNTVLVAFSTTFLTGTVSCGDSRGNVYTVDADYVASGSRLVVCSSSVTTMLTSPNTVNVSFAANSGGRVLIVTEFSGIRAAADRFDQFAKGHTTANSTAVSTDTVTLSQPDELLFGLVAADGPSGDALLLGQDGTSRPYTLLTKYGVSTQTLSVGYLTTTATGPYGMINATANPAHRLTAGVATYRAPAFGAASRLAFNVQPSNAAAGASLSPAVRVAIQDSSGNTVATSAASVTLAIGTNPGTSTLSGTVTASAVSGIATFSNLSLNNAGTGYRLQASSGALTPAVSSAFNVLGGSPTKLAIVTPAHSVAAGTCSAAVTVEARDAYDNPATLSGSATVNVTLSGAQLFSDSTCTTAFSSLALSTATSQGSAYFRGTVAGALTLNASSAGLTGTSQQEMVVAGAATTLEVHDFPAMVTAGQAANVTLTARDAFGNVATTFVGALQLSSSDPAAQVPSGLAMSAGNQGELVASVTLKTAGTRDLRASSGGLMGTQSGILVRHAFLHHLMVSGVPSPTRVGNWADLTVEAHDPYDNVVADYTGTVQLSSSDAQASLAPAFAFTLAHQGAAAITQAVRFRAPGTHSVVASDTGNALLYGAQTGIVVEADPPPVIQHNANLKAAVGVPYRFNGLGRIELTGIGTVTYEACGGPSGFRVDGLAGSVHWVPDAVGSVSLCVKASSSAGADTYNFTVNVIARTATDVTARLVATPS
ncbi:MAG: hypothetical protein ACT4TC_09495, partial [Myxococcaceae bacterium]